MAALQLGQCARRAAPGEPGPRNARGCRPRRRAIGCGAIVATRTSRSKPSPATSTRRSNTSSHLQAGGAAQLRQHGRHHLAAKAEAGAHARQTARFAPGHGHFLQQLVHVIRMRSAQWNTRSPSSVTATRRVVQCNSFTARSSSSRRMRLLTKAGETPSSRAASAKLALRTTAVKTRRSSGEGFMHGS